MDEISSAVGFEQEDRFGVSRPDDVHDLPALGSHERPIGVCVLIVLIASVSAGVLIARAVLSVNLR